MEDGEKQTGTREVETGRLLALLPEEVARMPHHVFETDTERIVLITAKENADGTVEEYAGFARGRYAPHIHDQTDSEFTIVTGTGTALIGDERIPYAPGTVLKAPRGVAHGFEADSDTWLHTQLSGHIYDEKTGVSDFRHP
ncbi:cupin domain-containing protein [Patescibacteria group bacterium]|nr:cupin domain-containing protein [Patescibacteria group bacterium]